LETAHLGHNFIYVPVVDIGRNPRWPRFYETFGESFLLCSQMGAAIVNGIQTNKEVLPYKTAACAKHFIGYSDPKSGWDRSPASIPEQELYEFYVPSFQACIDAGVKIIEANSGEVNGVPVHASHKLLTTLLRDKMGFKGVLNSDWEDLKKLVNYHGVAENEKEATYLGLIAGLDCILTPEDCLFAQYACELVREGRIPEERLDLSVKRILRLKYDLGLFDGNFRTEDVIAQRMNRTDAEEHAINAARESIVLLKNEKGILPLNPAKVSKIVVAGPNANSRSAICGAWTAGWSDVRDEYIPERVPTVYKALQTMYPNSKIESVNDISQLKGLSKGADAIIYVAGERPYAEYYGSVTDLTLPDIQIEEISQTLATGIPVIVVMLAGRPRVVSKIYERLAGFIWAGLPGYSGGTAIAEIIAGKVNPSGKLPFEYPQGASSYVNYNRKRHEEVMRNVLQMPVSMASFGDGLSYTKFSYKNLNISDTLITDINQCVNVTVEVTNEGNSAGKESVLWYITDHHGSFTRPVRELKYFEKQLFQPGETKKLSFKIIPGKHLAYPDEQGNYRIENGSFSVWAGGLEANINVKK
ncbi:MAG: glycoside hydrolase family 3 C-terminal domain-containing protein, partial [Dysgonamonadaceae bacterium]|nr:glycoside hydrolase family 3 C-terminal domain-containing protein [Dysgonamonadaceae bacterium]